ncbi:MAG: alanine--tRNA ligase-related protein [Oscillospiraceae bacterium]
MTEKLFYEDSTNCSFTAQVVRCEPQGKNYITVLNKTAFYPEGGGQPADKGILGGFEVLDVREKNGEIQHLLAEKLEINSIVSGEVNQKYRFSNCQQHTGEHIVSGIIDRLYGYDNVGFHMGSEVTTIDLNGELTAENLAEVEALANKAVYSNIPVIVDYPNAEQLAEMQYRSKKELTGSVRIVSIAGYDTCACCGTHTLTTGQIGTIKLLTSQKYKGGTRVSMLCGMDAMKDYTDKNNSVYTISAMLSAKVGEIVPAVQRLLTETETLKQQLAEIKIKQLTKIANEQPTGQQSIILFVSEFSPNELRQLCLLLCEKTELAAVLCGDDTQGYKYAVGSKIQDVRALSKELNTVLNGKGGGSKELTQGSFMASKTEIQEAINK